MNLHGTSRITDFEVYFIDGGVTESSTCQKCKNCIRGYYDKGICDKCKKSYNIIILPTNLIDDYKLNPFRNIVFYFAKYVFIYFTAKNEETNEYILSVEFIEVFKSIMFDTNKNSITLGTKDGLDFMGFFISFNQLSNDDNKKILRTCKFYANGTQAIVDYENDNHTKIIDVTGHTYEIEESGAFVTESESEQIVESR